MNKKQILTSGNKEVYMSAKMHVLCFSLMKKCLILLFCCSFVATAGAQKNFPLTDILVKTIYGGEVDTVPKLENAEIMKLIGCIPDHTLDQSPAWAFTTTYFSLLTEAWAIPSDAPGAIGSEDWLYYFLTGNGDGTCEPRIVESHQDNQYVRAHFVCDGEPAEPVSNAHAIVFQYNGTRWVIADFDNTEKDLLSYIHKMRTYFRSDKWSIDLKAMENLTEKERASAQKEVAKYFAKYPIDRD